MSRTGATIRSVTRSCYGDRRVDVLVFRRRAVSPHDGGRVVNRVAEWSTCSSRPPPPSPPHSLMQPRASRCLSLPGSLPLPPPLPPPPATTAVVVDTILSRGPSGRFAIEDRRACISIPFTYLCHRRKTKKLHLQVSLRYRRSQLRSVIAASFIVNRW